MRSLPVRRSSAYETEQKRDEIVHAIITFWREKQYAPSVRDLAQACQISPSNVFHHLEVLQTRGIIQRDPGVPRSIRIVSS